MKRAVALAWVVAAFALCLAPCSVGQQANSSLTTVGLPAIMLSASGPSTALTVRAATLLVTAEPLLDFNKKKKDPPTRNVTAPEGGSSLAYLAIASSVCLGALVLSYRRKKYVGRA
jgi:hypothetical protein